MAHHTVKQGYLDLVDRINRFPQGAPPSELLYRILEMLFSEREAELVSLLPIRPFTARWPQFSAPSSGCPRSNGRWPTVRWGHVISTS